MGAWSETIMGGDTPLDIRADFHDRFAPPDGWSPEDDYEEDYYFRGQQPLTEENFMAAVQSVAANYVNDWRDEAHLVYQVFAVQGMLYAVPFSENTKRILIERSEDTEEYAERWDDPERRKLCVKQFQDIIRDYDNTPTEVPEEGLFEKIAKDMTPTVSRETLLELKVNELTERNKQLLNMLDPVTKRLVLKEWGELEE
jgi:hypothetical protein